MNIRSISMWVIAFTLIAACKTKTYTLKFQPEANSRYLMQVSTDSDVTQEVMGQKMESKTGQVMTMSYVVEKTKGANTSLQMTFQSMRMVSEVAGQLTQMDTQSPDTTNPGTRMMQAMMGTQFNVEVDPAGNIVSFSGLENMTNRILDQLGSGDEAQSAQLSAMLKEFMGEEAMRNMLEQSFKLYPAKPVAIGDSWNVTNTLNKPVSMIIDANYTLKEVTEVEDVAKLDVKATVKPGKGGMNIMGMTIETELNGTMEGTLDVDLKSGLVTQSNLKQQSKGVMKMMGQEIPMRVNNITQLKLTRL